MGLRALGVFSRLGVSRALPTVGGKIIHQHNSEKSSTAHGWASGAKVARMSQLACALFDHISTQSSEYESTRPAQGYRISELRGIVLLIKGRSNPKTWR